MSLHVYNGSAWKSVLDLDVYSSGWLQVNELYVATPDNSVSPPGTIWELLDTYVAPSAAGETVTISQDSFGTAQVRLSVTGYSTYNNATFARDWEIEVNGLSWEIVSTGAGNSTRLYPIAGDNGGIVIGDSLRCRTRYLASNGASGTWSPWSSAYVVV